MHRPVDCPLLKIYFMDHHRIYLLLHSINVRKKLPRACLVVWASFGVEWGQAKKGVARSKRATCHFSQLFGYSWCMDWAKRLLFGCMWRSPNHESDEMSLVWYHPCKAIGHPSLHCWHYHTITTSHTMKLAFASVHRNSTTTHTHSL
jgi:hypothetical protein